MSSMPVSEVNWPHSSDCAQCLPPNVSLEQARDAARIHNKVVGCGWVEKVAVVRTLAAELKTVRRINRRILFTDQLFEKLNLRRERKAEREAHSNDS